MNQNDPSGRSYCLVAGDDDGDEYCYFGDDDDDDGGGDDDPPLNCDFLYATTAPGEWVPYNKVNSWVTPIWSDLSSDRGQRAIHLERG